MNVNRVVITGNLTRDPELRHTGSGTAVCDLGVAVNDREKQGEEWVERPSYFIVTVWGKQAENAAQYLAKGRPVAIDGKLRWESWEKDGQKRSQIKIVAQSVQYLHAKSDNGGGGFDPAPETDVPADAAGLGSGPVDDEDKIPF